MSQRDYQDFCLIIHSPCNENRVAVHSARYSIDDDLARHIVRLSQLVKDNDLYKVETFGHIASWLDKDMNVLSVDCHTLNVSRTDFWYGATFNDCEITTKRNPISELGINLDLPAASPFMADASIFVNQVASLSIWGYDKVDSMPYDECAEPDEGMVDSHKTLMAFIEKARKVQGTSVPIYSGYPYLSPQLYAMTHAGTEPLVVVVPIQLNTLIQEDIETLNDLVSDMITGSNAGITNIGYHALSIKSTADKSHDTTGEILIQVTAQVDFDLLSQEIPDCAVQTNQIA